MPLKNQPWTLHRVTTLSLATMVAETCTKITTEEEESSVREFTAEIPDFAAEKYLEDLLIILSDLEHTTYLRAALPPQCLRLTVEKKTDLEEALVTHLDILVKLEHLIVEHIYSHPYDDLTWQFPKLITLDLGNQIKSETLLKITENCPNLTKLRFDIDSFRLDPEMLSICKCVQLRSLEVWCKEVQWTASDLVYLLDNLPHLRTLDIALPSDYRKEFLRECLMMISHGKPNQLKSLFYTSACGKYRDTLDLLGKCVPKLERLEVCLHHKSTKCLNLRNFTNLQKLSANSGRTHLQIHSECCARLVDLKLCDVDVISLFKEMFPNLKTLSLRQCRNGDITAIAEKCPNIETLYISDFDDMCFSVPKSSYGHYVHLKHVCFKDRLHVEPILFIMSSCKELKTLTLIEYDRFVCKSEKYIVDDNLLKCILDKNPMENLESLTVKTYSIRYDMVATIMSSFPELHRIELGADTLELSLKEHELLENQIVHFDLSWYIMECI